MVSLAINIAAFLFLAWLSLVAIAIVIRFPAILGVIALVAFVVITQNP